MIFRALRSYAGIMSLALFVSACGGGGGGGPQQPPPQPQTIAFATAGPVTSGVGTTVTNIASGGAGTGAITYASGTTTVATVNATTGVATLVGTGSATITATKAASSGFNSATATYQLQATPGTQTIAFAVLGPRNVVLATTSDNAASGGAGTGAITYASSNTNAVTVNATTGAATAAGLGSATITATKAADANYNAAQATYVANVQSAGSVHAWVGEQSSEVFLPATANGKQFGRVKVADCTQLAVDLVNCVNVESSPVNGASILDTRTTLTTAAYHAIVDGATAGEPIVANAKRFSERILHGAGLLQQPLLGHRRCASRSCRAPGRLRRCTSRSRMSGRRATARPGGSRPPPLSSARAGCTRRSCSTTRSGFSAAFEPTTPGRTRSGARRTVSTGCRSRR